MNTEEMDAFMFSLGWRVLSRCSDADLYGSMLGDRATPRETMIPLLELAGHRVFNAPNHPTPLYLYVYHESE